MMQRWISLWMVACLLLGSLTVGVCATETEVPTQAPTEAPTEEPAEEATGAPTEEPTEEATVAPTEDPAEDATEEPTETPTEEPTEPPATTGSCGASMSWSFDPATGKLTISGSGAMDDCTEQPWGDWTSQITSVAFGSEIRSVGKLAFAGCKALKQVRFTGKAPGTIEADAFRGVTATVFYPGLDISWTKDYFRDYGGSLTWKPEVPGGVGGVFNDVLTWHLVDGTLSIAGKGNMGGWASGVENPPWYPYREQVKKVVMSEQIYCIYTGAFRDMPNLTEVVFPRDLNIIYSSAFYNCTGLTKVSLPSAVSTISDYAFYGCENLKEITMPNGMKELGKGVFMNCKALESVKLPDKLRSIGQKAFAYSVIRSIILPEGITELPLGIFLGCRSLTGVTLMGNVGKIGAQCFENCTQLKSIQLPASVKSIGEKAFAESGLREMVFGGDMPTMGVDALKGVKAAVFYPKDNDTWSGTRIQVLEKTYPGALTFYAGTPDSLEPETQPPETTAPTEESTEAATEPAATEPEQTGAVTEPAEEIPVPTEPETEAATEPEQQTQPAQEQPEAEVPAQTGSILDYWPLAVAAVWVFGGSALAVWLLLIRPFRRR